MAGRSRARGSAVDAIDDAFLRLRRLWSASRHRVEDDGTIRIELSSLLVVEACARKVEARAEANVSDVAFLADVTSSTATRLVDTAERAGLLRRQRSAYSGRRTALVLTPDGQALRARAVEARRSWLNAQLANWSAAEVEQFGELLQRFADGLHTRPFD